MGFVEARVTGKTGRITLQRPPVNVVDLATARELARALEDLGGRKRLAAVVLAAAGKTFCAGVDVRDHLPDRGAGMLHEFHRCCKLLLELDAPVVAVVHGAALGGGCELTLCCDIVLAAESASFGVPEIKLGVFPPVASVALPRMIAPHRASDLVLTGRTLTAREAERAGLVSRTVPDGELERELASVIGALEALSPSSLAVAKQALRLSRQRPSAEEIDAAEGLYLERLLHDPDAVEGLTSFLEKRSPRWN